MDRKPLSAVGVLLGAASLVERKGLARNNLVDEDGRVCTVRALQAQVLGDTMMVPWWEDTAWPMPPNYALALRLISQHLGWADWLDGHRLEDQVIAWSDTMAADTADAVETLRRAAFLGSQTRLVVGA